jgi:hypothetical protein
MLRLTRIHLAIIGLVVIIAIALVFNITQIKPRMQTLQAHQATIDKESQFFNQNDAQSRNLNAKLKLDLVAAKVTWQKRYDAKMSQLSIRNPYLAPFSINQELPTYGPQLTRALDKNRKEAHFMGNIVWPGSIGWNPAPPQALTTTADLPFHFKDLVVLKKWFATTESLPRVMELGNSITIAVAAPGLNVTLPGAKFYIMYRDSEGNRPTDPAIFAASGAPGGGGGGSGVMNSMRQAKMSEMGDDKGPGPGMRGGGNFGGGK